MKQETIAEGRTVEAAVADGARELGIDVSNVEYEIIEQPKKGFLGFGETMAKVRVFCHEGPDMTALHFVNTLIANMNLNATATITADTVSNGDRLIQISGEDAGVLIGHHGDTLDSLQYLVNLAANRREDETHDGNHIKITVDIENYRAKREETLRRLARGMAARVAKSREQIELEPMSPYERRIIHSEIQSFRGVTTSSTGTDDDRHVVIMPDRSDRSDRGGNRGGRYDRPRRPRQTENQPSAEAKPADEETSSENE